tara:strand:- start:7461 stop:7733 length:273 start_codon:yes stop_codon:yes gene_type:complete
LYLDYLEVGDPDDLDMDELGRLTDWHPLMQPALDFLKEKELGLAPSRAETRHILRESIALVNSEIHRQRDDRREQDREMEAARQRARESL